MNTIAANIVANQDALAKYGIEVQGANGNLKSTYDILAELKPKWDAMTDAERASLGQTLAGKNQFKVLSAVMQNFESAINAVAVAEEAQGSAMRENDRYMESFEAKVTALKAAWQNLSVAIIDSGINDAVGALATFVQTLSESKVAIFAIKTLLGTGAIWGVEELSRASKLFAVIGGQNRKFRELLGILGEVKEVSAATGLTFVESFTALGNLSGGAAAILSGSLLPAILAIVAAVTLVGTVVKEVNAEREKAAYAASSAGIIEVIQSKETELETYRKELEALEASSDEANTLAQKRIDWLRDEISGIDQDLNGNASEVKRLKKEIDELEKKQQGNFGKQRAASFWLGWDAQLDELKKQLEEAEGLYLNAAQARISEIEAQYANRINNYGEGFWTGTGMVYTPTIEYSAFYQDLQKIEEATENSLSGAISESQYLQSLQAFVNEYGNVADEIYECAEAGVELDETTADIYTSVIEAREVLEKYGVSLDDISKGFDDIVESSALAEEKLKAFDEATKTDKGDTFKKYQEDYKKFLEAYKKGELGSTTIEAAVDLYVPDEVKKELKYDYEAMIEWLAGLGDDKFTSRILSSQNAVQTFGQILREEMGSSNQILGENQEIIAEYKDGEYYFSSYEDLAKYFKTDVTLIKSLFQNMRLFSGQVELTGEEMDDFLASMREELPQYANEFGNLNVTTTNQLTEIAGAIAKINKTSDPTEIAGYIKALQDAGAITIDPEVDISDAIDGIEEVEEEAKDLSKQNTRVTITANTSSAVNNLTDLLNYWKRIKKEMESGITPSTPSDDGRPTTTGPTRAKGDKNFQGGLAIVNDGAPVNGSSAELIIDNGEAFIANGGEETPINLNKGAKIYTAAETNKIFNGNVPKSFSVPSFAGGTGWDLSGGSSTVTPNTKTLTTSSTEKMKEEFDKWQREHEHMLAMDEITEEQYYADLEAMIEQYLKDKEEYLDEYWRYEEEIYRYRKELMEDQQAQMEDIIDLQEKLNELERVKTQKLLVYKDGRFQYVSNTEAIANAQRQIDATGLTLGTSVAPVSGGVTASTTNIGTATAVSGIGGFGQYGDTINNTFNINEIKLENVADVESLFSGLKTLALQSVASRA